MTQSVKQAAETATTLVRETLPKRLPTIFGAPAPKRRASRATKVVKARAATAKKRAKRVARRATRRG
jgi:hypothetical protein